MVKELKFLEHDLVIVYAICTNEVLSLMHADILLCSYACSALYRTP